MVKVRAKTLFEKTCGRQEEIRSRFRGSMGGSDGS